MTIIAAAILPVKARKGTSTEDGSHAEAHARGCFCNQPEHKVGRLSDEQGAGNLLSDAPSVESITPEQDDRLLLELRAQYITEMSRQVSRWAGPAEYIAVSYEKFIELIILLNDKYLAVTLEKNVPIETLVDITTSVRNLELRSLAAI